MKKKSVWLINQYLCTPELNGDDHRHSFLAEEWIKRGYDVTLITSSFSHVPYRENKIKGLFDLRENHIRTLLIKGNKYSDSQGFSRIVSWLVFCFLLFFIPTKKIPKPDIIIVSSNSLLPILNVVYFFKKKFREAKFLLEIRDIWPLTLIEVGNFSTKNIFIRGLSWVEKLGYKKADIIVSLLEHADKHIAQILKENSFQYEWISNGYKLQDNSYYKEIPISIANKIPKNKFVVGYAGSLGRANAMEYIIESFKHLDSNKFALCLLGIGDEMKALKEQAKGFDNIIFLGKVKKSEVLSFLKKCDLLYLGVRNLNLYKFGISMNKTFDYLYAQKPVLLSVPVKDSIVKIAECGVEVMPEKPKVLGKEIIRFEQMNISQRLEMGEKGKIYLLDHFTYQKLAEKYIKIFNEL